VGNKKLNRSKQIRSLMPNLIHSMDASSLALLSSLFFDSDSNFNNFYSIHDCFAVTANNVSKLIGFIKLVYINIYSDNQYIKKFDQGIIDNIKLQYGDKSFDDISKKIKVNGIDLDYPDVNEVISGKISAYNIRNSNCLIS
jgi:DNA-directed RNA polymerase